MLPVSTHTRYRRSLITAAIISTAGFLALFIGRYPRRGYPVAGKSS